MKKHWFAFAVFLVLTILSLAQGLRFAWDSPGMDGPGESHGGEPGEPALTTIVQLAVTGLLVITFLGAAVGLPRIAEWALNIPHKEYWLSAERRQATFDYLVPWFLWFGSADLLLMLSVFRQARLAETGQGKPSDLLLMVAGHTIVSMVFVIHLLVRFSGVPSSHAGKRKGERA